jgi:hypothetical protein
MPQDVLARAENSKKRTSPKINLQNATDELSGLGLSQRLFKRVCFKQERIGEPQSSYN